MQKTGNALFQKTCPYFTDILLKLLNRVIAVMEHVQVMYYLPTMVTKIHLDTLSIDHISGYAFSQHDPLGNALDIDVVNIINAETGDTPNLYVFLGHIDPGFGTFTAGIAWTGSVCYPAQYVTYRSSVNLYYSNDLDAAYTIAHEIGKLSSRKIMKFF